MISGRTGKGTLIQLPISIEGHSVDSVIAAGATAVVFRGTNEITGEIVALKAMSKDDIVSPKDLQRLNLELQIACRLSHPNVIKTFRVIHTEDLEILVMEHCPSTVLDWALDGLLDSAQSVFNIFGKIANAIQYLHGMGIAHGDLKPDNILMDEDGNPKLADFGLCHTSLFAGDERKSGTNEYIAPELLMPGWYQTQKADIWALGIIFFALMTKEFPFKPDVPIFKQIRSGKLLYHLLVDEGVQNLMRQMTKMKPWEWPTIEQVLDDSLFAGDLAQD
jgi:serine/threonine protein kinase